MKVSNLYKVGFQQYITGSGRLRKKDISGMYLNMLLLIAAGEHEYNTPDYNKFFYELAIRTGIAAFYKCTSAGSVNYGKWCCTPAKPADTINNMLLSKKITTAGSDYSMELTVGEDCILIYNNSSLEPDTLFLKYAEDLTETAISASKLTKWARMTPIPKVNNDTDIVKYEELMKRILEGEDINVITEELSLLQEGHKTLDDNVLRLTDESSVDKLHFFDQHSEQILRKFATLRGLPFSSTAKNAQNLQEELHDMDAISTFMIKDEIACREDGFRRAAAFMKDKYDEDFDFAYKPSETLIRQLDRTSIEYRQQLAETARIESEATQKVSDADMREAQAEKFQAEADKLEAETEKLEAEAEKLEAEAEKLEEPEDIKEGEEDEKTGTADGDNTVLQ